MSVTIEPAASPPARPEPSAEPVLPSATWRHRHLLDLDELTWPEFELVMRTTDSMREVLRRPIAKVPALRGKSVTILFYEASTRTRVSFEVAAKNLSADVVNITASASSVSKGESLIDTVRTIEALGADMLVMRHAVSGAPYLAAEHFSGSILNGGDGWHAHPSQALLDLYTMRSHFGGVSLRGPATLLRGFERWAASARGTVHGGFHVTSDLPAALRDADVVMALRIQRERQAGGLLPSLREYAARFGLTRARVALAKPGVLVMHPGPMNEGVEIASDVAVGPGSVITEQVTNGVAVRMAMLYLLAGASPGHPRG